MERVADKDKAPHFWDSHVHMHISIPKVGAAIQSPQLRHILGASAETFLLKYLLHSDSALFHSYHISLPLLLATWVYKRQEGFFFFLSFSGSSALR